jgi:hypothetical protein
MSEPTSGSGTPLATISRVPSVPTIVVDEGLNRVGEEPVQEIRRVGTEKSTHDDGEASPQKTHPASFTSSAITLSGFNAMDGLDLEKTLRLVVMK